MLDEETIYEYEKSAPRNMEFYQIRYAPDLPNDIKLLQNLCIKFKIHKIYIDEYTLNSFTKQFVSFDINQFQFIANRNESIDGVIAKMIKFNGGGFDLINHKFYILDHEIEYEALKGRDRDYKIVFVDKDDNIVYLIRYDSINT